MGLIRIMEQAAGAPFLDRRGPRKLLNGILLSFIPVVSFLSYGYVMTVLEDRLDGHGPDHLPPWEKLERLFFLGTVFMLMLLTYCLVPYFLLMLAPAMLRMSLWLFIPSGAVMALSAALWLAAIFFLPMAAALFLKTGSILKILALQEIFRLIEAVLGDYFKVTLISLAAVIMITLPLVISPFGYLVSAPLSFILWMYLASVYGEICLPAFSG